jgi:hypothetical protein
MNKLEEIFYSFNVKLFDGEKHRHVVDVLEDLFLKLNAQEYQLLMQSISRTESKEGHIFDQARNRPYQ